MCNSKSSLCNLGCTTQGGLLFNKDGVLHVPFKVHLHRRFLSRQLNAIFVALKLQLQIALVNRVQFSVRFVTAISQEFRGIAWIKNMVLVPLRCSASKVDNGKFFFVQFFSLPNGNFYSTLVSGY